jgi:PAS domain S-box-containing protein
MNKFVYLRQQAENVVSQPEVFLKLSLEETQHLIHELHVHQVELEMQNDQLLQAQEQLQTSYNKYLDLYDFAPVGYFTITQRGKIVEANLTLVNLLGINRNNLIGQQFTHFIDKDSQDAFYLYCQQMSVDSTTETTQHPNCELQLVNQANNQLFYARLEGRRVLDRQDNLNYIHTAVIDITERKQAETALEAERASLEQRVNERTAELSVSNAELARAARMKDEFLATMSHELRTPLSAILGFAGLMLQNIHGPLNKKQRNDVNIIEASGNHLLSLINEILDLSRIEAGKMKLKIEAVSVKEVCQASLLFVEQTAQNKQIKISCPRHYTVDTLLTDAPSLKQIMVNLLSNAVKFTPEGGKIDLKIEGNEDEEVVYFTVSDNGIGIPEHEFKHLFKPFMQIDSSLSRQYEGTGLGLSLVYRLSDMLGGSVSVISEMGQGSHFIVSLPWQLPNNNQSPTIDNQPVSEHKTSMVNHQLPPLVLLVEDNESNLIMIQTGLQARNYQVITARNGLEAIERLKETEPAVVLMDIQMPGMDGLKAIRCIRDDANFSDIPIIALTALAMPGDREHCLTAGANDYLAKPVSLNKLINTITHLIPALGD